MADARYSCLGLNDSVWIERYELGQRRNQSPAEKLVLAVEPLEQETADEEHLSLTTGLTRIMETRLTKDGFRRDLKQFHRPIGYLFVDQCGL